jgi:curved DNA-binding protein CbpA
MRQFVRFAHQVASFYEILEVLPTSSIKDIKLQFKKLSKKYHPDLNSHLSGEQKKQNSEHFIRIVNAYETLKDKTKKAEYDRGLNTGRFTGGPAGGARSTEDYASPYSYNNARKEWEQLYYGTHRYQGGSRMNRTRNRVKHDSMFTDAGTTFDGKHRNYGDRFNVPHFNYEEHLLKHLKFEQRIINRQLTEEEREAIILQLTKNADILEISEELITKHLKRNINKKDRSNMHTRESINMASTNPYMYQKPKQQRYTYSAESETEYDDGSTLKAMVLFTGATGSLYMIYNLLFG